MCENQNKTVLASVPLKLPRVGGDPYLLNVIMILSPPFYIPGRIKKKKEDRGGR
jgi:hypothetical protein